MTFLWPMMLLWLLLVPLGIGLYVREQHQRQRVAARYGSMGFWQGAGRAPGRRRHVPPALFLLGLTILLVALARPQTVVSLPRIEGIVMLAFDVSGSMVADDVDPTRLEAAKAIARELVGRQPTGVQIGVVAFSEGGFAVQTPTNDQVAILAAINRITPQRGTSLGQGILASLNAIAAATGQAPVMLGEDAPTPTPVPVGFQAPAVIVLLSDGENHERPHPLEAAQTATDRGVRIHTLGVGSTAGATLEVEGFTVHTQLDEAMLQSIAAHTGGTYTKAEDSETLAAVYDNLDLQLVVEPVEMEITSLFAGAGILLFLLGGMCSLLWFGRLP